tara:strand:- start:6809 stop:7225 length:417 start_codon:yes stop_codon:yes gene_type:complete
MAIFQFSRAGFSFANNVSLSATKAAAACTADSTNAAESATFPRFASIRSVEFQLSSVSGASSITFRVTRDAAGDVAVSDEVTKTILAGKTTAADGSVVVDFDKDIHFMTGISVADTIYVIAETNAGTATADILVNWRA